MESDGDWGARRERLGAGGEAGMARNDEAGA